MGIKPPWGVRKLKALGQDCDFCSIVSCVYGMKWFSPAHLSSPAASLSLALEVALACAKVQAPCKLCLVLLSHLWCAGCPYEGSWELLAELLVEGGARMFLHHISHPIS